MTVKQISIIHRYFDELQNTKKINKYSSNSCSKIVLHDCIGGCIVTPRTTPRRTTRLETVVENLGGAFCRDRGLEKTENRVAIPSETII